MTLEQELLRLLLSNPVVLGKTMVGTNNTTCNIRIGEKGCVNIAIASNKEHEAALIQKVLHSLLVEVSEVLEREHDR